MHARHVTFTAGALALAAATTLAQDQDQHGGSTARSDRSFQHQSSSNRIYRLGQFIGREVETRNGREIGDIRNFVLDLNRGEVALVVLDVDEDIADGNRLIVAPFEALKFEPVAASNDPIELNVQASMLHDAPPFRDSDLDDESYREQIERHYIGERSFDQDRTRRTHERERSDAWPTRDADTNYPSSTGNPGGGVAGDPDNADDFARDDDHSFEDRHDVNRDRQMGGRTRTVITLNGVNDAKVVNRDDQDLGDIKEVLVDLGTGQIVYAVLSHGGIMGMGEHLHAVPVQAFTIEGAIRDPRLVLDIDRDRLDDAPTLKNVPTTHDPELTREIIAFYDVSEPQFVYGFAEEDEVEGLPSDREDHGTVRGMAVNSIIAHWPQASRRAAQDMVQKYGQPRQISSTMLVWNDVGDWKKCIVYEEEVEHMFPVRHTDVLEQCIDYRVPEDRMNDLAEFNGSLIVYRTGGGLAARCNMEPMNILALNLAHEIVTGRRTPAEARQFFAETAERYVLGESSEYTQQLMFDTGARDTADPDRPWAQSGGQRGRQPNETDHMTDDNRRR